MKSYVNHNYTIMDIVTLYLSNRKVHFHPSAAFNVVFFASVYWGKDVLKGDIKRLKMLAPL